MTYSISSFWKSRLGSGQQQKASASLPGWSVDSPRNPFFVEANLALDDMAPNLSAPIWFIAAPGAVGKSTLAKEICAQTGSIYLDLASANTVAGNYLTGGLAKTGLLSAWQQGIVAIAIDALDEARLRVTQDSFEDFLEDVLQMSKGRKVPTLMLGRVGIVEESWIALADMGVECPTFTIEYFNSKQACDFALATLRRLGQESSSKYPAVEDSMRAHFSVYKGVAEGFIREIESVAASDGPRFFGYAPVLEAVSTIIAGEPNPSKLSGPEIVQQKMRGGVLKNLTNRILQREALKVRDQLTSIPEKFRKVLYEPEEQLARLAAITLHAPIPLPPALPPEHRATYQNSLDAFVPQHPFLDGTGVKPASAVFDAFICAHALFSADKATVAAAERHAGIGPNTPNPFLFDYYWDLATEEWGEDIVVSPVDAVLLFESLRARSAPGETVRLTIEGDEESDTGDVEIQITNHAKPVKWEFKMLQAGDMVLAKQISGISIDAPKLNLTIGRGDPVDAIAPISISVNQLAFECPQLVVTGPKANGGPIDNAVAIEAKKLVRSDVTAPPNVRHGAELGVSWPGSEVYPWTSFQLGAQGSDHPDLHAGLLALRRLVLSFRSHSRGRLGRYIGKIEHARMTKNKIGEGIRQRLVADGALTVDTADAMYYLDPDRLGQLIGVGFNELRMKRFSPITREYVSRSLTPTR